MTSNQKHDQRILKKKILSDNTSKIRSFVTAEIRKLEQGKQHKHTKVYVSQVQNVQQV